MALGMFLTSLAFLILFVAAKSGGDQTFLTDARASSCSTSTTSSRSIQHHVSPLWLIAAYMVISLGELMLSPMGLSLVSKVAPVPDARADDGRLVRRHGHRQQADGDR